MPRDDSSAMRLKHVLAEPRPRIDIELALLQGLFIPVA